MLKGHQAIEAVERGEGEAGLFKSLDLGIKEYEKAVNNLLLRNQLSEELIAKLKSEGR